MGILLNLKQKIIIPVFLLLVFHCELSVGQDLLFSQYEHSSMLLNPGSLASEDALRFGGMYRKMNLLDQISFQSSFFFLESPVYFNNQRYGGVGIAMFNSSDGDVQPIQLSGGILAISKRIKVTRKSFLSLGFQGGYYRKKLDYGQYSTGNQWIDDSGYNPDLPSGETIEQESAHALNLNTGLFWYVPGRMQRMKTALGVSLYHINQPEYTFIEAGEAYPLTLALYGHQRIYEVSQFTTHLSAMYRYGNEQLIALGSCFTFFPNTSDGYNLLDVSHVDFNMHYVHDRAVVLGVKIGRKNLSLGFSYDIGLPGSYYERATGGIYELSFVLRNPFKSDREPSRPIQGTITSVEEREFFTDSSEEKDKNIQQQQARTKPDSLVEKIEGLKSEVVRDARDGLSFKLSKNFKYAFNDASLKEPAKTFLKELVILMLQNPSLNLRITGHTDNIGTQEDNQKISEQRAENVADYLIENGVHRDRISHNGIGAAYPVVPNNSESNREKNRRVEFEIYVK